MTDNNYTNPKFKLGDIVALKSGGPNMTITSLKSHFLAESFTGTYMCTWFDGHRKNTEPFIEESLISMDED
ncbi:DUF2158 domain-containing protein [Chitinophaga caeni]|uniref:DUF2158 domain-containing protein n=1 Tax=Chitinophaga caeni TaxID=2029983 RepID=A0A291QRM2_9BACT|nr:DUF2158 domain-containing protein [Chitinophaga caeni]ATL46561.1 DUF2158 domain-containing protein [Chitinophaga caeni]